MIHLPIILRDGLTEKYEENATQSFHIRYKVYDMFWSHESRNVFEQSHLMTYHHVAHFQAFEDLLRQRCSEAFYPKWQVFH